MRAAALLCGFLALALSSGPALAQDGSSPDPSRWSLQRLAGGIGVGYVLQDSKQLENPQSGALLRAAVSFNQGLLSGVLYGQGVPGSAHSLQAAIGLRGHLLGTTTSEAFGVAVGLDYVMLRGEFYDALEMAFNADPENIAAERSWKREAAKLSLRLSSVLIRDDSGRGVIGLQVVGESIPDNDLLDVWAALAWQIFGGKS